MHKSSTVPALLLEEVDTITGENFVAQSVSTGGQHRRPLGAC